MKSGTPANARSGPPPVMSSAEEEMLEEWITHMCKIGYSRTRDQLTLTVKAIILDKDGRPNPFTNNRPGKDRMKAFLSRPAYLVSITVMSLAFHYRVGLGK